VHLDGYTGGLADWSVRAFKRVHWCGGGVEGCYWVLAIVWAIVNAFQ
jgi:hypothetical protein